MNTKTAALFFMSLSITAGAYAMVLPEGSAKYLIATQIAATGLAGLFTHPDSVLARLGLVTPSDGSLASVKIEPQLVPAADPPAAPAEPPQPRAVGEYHGEVIGKPVPQEAAVK